MLIIPLAGFTGCASEAPKEATHITTTDGSHPPPDTGEPATGADTPLGVVVVMHWPEDRYFADTTWAQGLFSTTPEWQGVISPVGALRWSGANVDETWLGWPMPDGPTPNAAFDETLPLDPTTSDYLDAGERVLIGEDVELYYTESAGFVYYQSDPSDVIEAGPFASGAAMLFEVDGGAHVAAQALTSVVEVPEPVVIEGVDPTLLHILHPDAPLDITWTPSASANDTMLVTAIGEYYATTRLLDDDEGGVSFTADELQDLAGDFIAVTLARMVETEVQLDEGVVVVRAIEESWTNWVQVNELNFYPRTMLSGQINTIEFHRAEGTFTESAELDLGEGIFVEDIELLDAGHTARVRLLVDEDAEAEWRPVQITDSGTTLTAPSDIGVYHPIIGGETCDEALFLPPLRTGFHYDDRDGRTSEVDLIDECGVEINFNGAESFHRVSLQAGERLRVSAALDLGDVAIGLMRGCDYEWIDCWNETGYNSTEVLDYLAAEDEDVIVVFDESDASTEGELTDLFVSVEIDAAVDLYLLERVRQGDSHTFTIENRSWDFVQDEVSFDFGAGVTVDSITVDGGTGPDATVSISVATDATPGDRVITATQGASTGVSRLQDFEVIGVLPPSDSCADADLLPPLTEASWVGTTAGLSDEGFDTVLCGVDEMPAYDAIYRIEVPADGDSVGLTLNPTFDGSVYLVRDCAPDTLPVACEDKVADNDIEYLGWTAGAGESGTWYVVVDSRYASHVGEFTLFTQVH